MLLYSDLASRLLRHKAVCTRGCMRMITTVVEFDLPVTLNRDEAREVFRSTAPIYLGCPGLIFKTYILGSDGRKAGGVYVWDSREAAERAYDDAWRARVRQRYGVDPTVKYFDTPVIVDNRAARIVVD